MAAILITLAGIFALANFVLDRIQHQHTVWADKSRSANDLIHTYNA